MLTRARLAWRLYRDPRVAPRMKVFLPILAVVYLISPIDVVPDVLLGVGQLDDLTVILLVGVVLSRLVRWAPAEIIDEHMTRLLHRSRSGASARSEWESTPASIIDADFEIVESRRRNQRPEANAPGY